ncbi:MAG: hypothetical protein ACK55I_11515, partial [bacterium]
SDLFSVSDTQRYSLSKLTQDTFSTEDSSTFDFLAGKSDSIFTSEIFYRDFSKLLSDTALADDRFSIEDELQQTIGKSLADEFSISDAVSFAVNFNRSFSETEYVID